ncbi:MAG TPA: UrcA family protein [Steroidobacteraceae bacterium]|jgi:UrcA family protein|nr:UrcA family protein [Steroidobacteraceae bacterium]
MNTLSKSIQAGLAALMLATAVAVPAHATDAVVVRYDDLNLATPAGNAVLYRRIEQAAKVVCPEYPAGDVRRIRISRPCYQEAVAHAVASIHKPSLTAFYIRSNDGPFSMPAH